jgi:catechol 2,3-dioxygenase-like lactoylglutathione lyase family enzyme
MNHVAFNVAPEHIESYRERLIAAGVECTEVANHDDSEYGISKEFHPGVFVRSVYFLDPDGILLELACWTRELGRPEDVAVVPRRALSPADS